MRGRGVGGGGGVSFKTGASEFPEHPNPDTCNCLPFAPIARKASQYSCLSWTMLIWGGKGRGASSCGSANIRTHRAMECITSHAQTSCALGAHLTGRIPHLGGCNGDEQEALRALLV